MYQLKIPSISVSTSLISPRGALFGHSPKVTVSPSLAPLQSDKLSEEHLVLLINSAKVNRNILKTIEAVSLAVQRLKEVHQDQIVVLLLDLLFVLVEFDGNAKSKLSEQPNIHQLLLDLRAKNTAESFLESWSKLLASCSTNVQFANEFVKGEYLTIFLKDLKLGAEAVKLNTISIINNLYHLYDSSTLADSGVSEALAEALNRESEPVQLAVLNVYLALSTKEDKMTLASSITPLVGVLKNGSEAAKSVVLDIVTHMSSQEGLKILLDDEGATGLAQELLHSGIGMLESKAKEALVAAGVLSMNIGGYLGSGGMLGGMITSTWQNVSTTAGSVSNGVSSLVVPTQNSIASLIDLLKQAPQAAKLRLISLEIAERDASLFAGTALIKAIIECALASQKVKAALLFLLGKVAMHSSAIVQYITPYLSSVIDLLRSSDPLTQNMAVEALWMLAFESDCKDKLLQDEETMSLLKELEQSDPQSEVAQKAHGVLFVLNHNNSPKLDEDQISGTTSTNSHQRNVMISYNWGNQTVAKKIHESLTENGFKVWIDVEKMSGSILEAMATAVEEAEFVLVCYSRKYKESAPCRTEAEYAYALKKKIIPLKVEDYVPDGWLGALLGTKLYHQFLITEDHRFSASLAGLLKELGVENTYKSPTMNSTPTPVIDTWSTSDVEEWLAAIGLETYQSVFSDNFIDGKALHELQYIYTHRTSEKINVLLEPLHLSLGHRLRFLHELRKLK